MLLNGRNRASYYAEVLGRLVCDHPKAFLGMEENIANLFLHDVGNARNITILKDFMRVALHTLPMDDCIDVLRLAVYKASVSEYPIP